MARAFPNTQPAAAETEPQTRDWQALRGELVTLLDQMEGQYAHGGSTDPGLAQRMRDLRYQVIETDPDDRRREALRSVKRQIDRFNDRGEVEPATGGDNLLQSAIQQIRARTQGDPAAAPRAAAEAPRYGELAQTMTALNQRLGQLEAELGAQRSNGPQVKEIASQVGQLSHVVELLAGAVGETGQVKRLESQIAGLATLINAGKSVDLSQLTERLDQVSATVDRLADLQVQQIQHVVREAEAAPQQSADSIKTMQAIELSVRNIYDRIDALEHNLGAPPPELEQITEMLGLIGSKLANDGSGRPDRLLSLVDALNARINEMESKGEAFAELKDDIGQLRDAVIEGIEPRFSALESRLGDLGERLDKRSGDTQGFAQVEAQIRQLVARMDQTGEQLANLAAQHAEAEERHAAVVAPDFEALAAMTAARTADAIAKNRPPGPNLNDLAERAATHAFAAMGRREVPPPDFNVLADLVATRTTDALKTYSRLPTEQLEIIAELLANRTSAALAGREAPPPDLEALADLVAARTNEAMKGYAQLPTERLDGIAAMVAKTSASLAARDSISSPAPVLSAASLDEIEARVARLVDGFAAARTSEGPSPTEEGLNRVEQRLLQVEASLTRRSVERDTNMHGFETPAEIKAAPLFPAPAEDPPASAAVADEPRAIAAPARSELDDSMPRDPSVDAPLKEFGFPDLGPVRAALEARSAQPRSIVVPPAVEAPAMDPLPPTNVVMAPAPMLAFDPASVVPPPRPQSSFDREVDTAFSAPATPAAAPADPLPASSRNTFIEAARRSAQRANAAPHGNPDSAIGRALSRFQSTRIEKAATPAIPEPAPPVAAEPATPAARKKPARIKLLSRGGKATTAPAAAPEPIVPNSPAPAELPDMAAEVRPAPQGSFLSRHRRAILITASLVAVSVMTLNLVAQRLAPGSSQAPASDVAVGGAKPVATVLPAQAVVMPAAGPSSALPQAVSASTAAAPATLHASSLVVPAPTGGPGPRIAAAADLPATPDPMTTASIAPGETLDRSKGPLVSALPPALPAAAPTASAAPSSSAGPTVTLATAAPGPVAAQPAPAAIQSPVKVELPPDAVGPLDLRQSAANGDARSQFEIAAIYSEGRAVPQDFKEAAVWYERAAAQGFVPAQYRLGNLYETGKGMPQDYEQARLWYERAAEAGNRMAMHNLAALYAGGQFGKQDFTSAANWFQQAADLGIRDSQFNLGMLYARGLGVPQSLETAYKWFSLAAATGDSGSAKARDDIARSLDAATLKQATAEAAAWKPKPVNLAANFAPIGTWEKTFNPGPTIATKDVILKVQQALTRLGYDVGTPDGHAGPKTAIAIKAFEQGTGMTQVGAINPRLLAVLGSQPV